MQSDHPFISSAVSVESPNATFKMEGGEISSIKFKSGIRGDFEHYVNGAVRKLFYGAGGSIDISGGSITGNIRNSDLGTDIYVRESDVFRLSGNARIGTIRIDSEQFSIESSMRLSGSATIDTLMLVHDGLTSPSVIIDGNYSGTVSKLHLSTQNFIISDYYNLWTNKRIIVNGTANNINMFNDALGYFFNFDPMDTPIRTTHILNANGVLVRK
jgi:hypothetical protein